MTLEITVNECSFDVIVDHISYEGLIVLAGMPERNDLTVTYYGKTQDGRPRMGTLLPGQSIDVEDGMIFDAVYTGDA